MPADFPGFQHLILNEEAASEAIALEVHNCYIHDSSRDSELHFQGLETSNDRRSLDLSISVKEKFHSVESIHLNETS